MFRGSSILLFWGGGTKILCSNSSYYCLFAEYESLIVFIFGESGLVGEMEIIVIKLECSCFKPN